MTALVHRIFLVPVRSDVDPSWAHQHWTSRHAEIFGRTPGLRGYTQNCPPPDAWSGRTHICAEAWFDDRPAEREAFRSPYYVDEVIPDENRFVERSYAWHAGVDDVRCAARTQTYRVLAFGHTAERAADWLSGWDEDAVDVLALDRPAPIGGPRSVLGLWTSDKDRAAAAARHFGPLAWVTQPVAVVPAPRPPWNGDRYG